MSADTVICENWWPLSSTHVTNHLQIVLLAGFMAPSVSSLLRTVSLFVAVMNPKPSCHRASKGGRPMAGFCKNLSSKTTHFSSGRSDLSLQIFPWYRRTWKILSLFSVRGSWIYPLVLFRWRCAALWFLLFFFRFHGQSRNSVCKAFVVSLPSFMEK